MSLIKMITQGLLGGIDEGGGGGGLLSQKPSNGGLPKWNSDTKELLGEPILCWYRD